MPPRAAAVVRATVRAPAASTFTHSAAAAAAVHSAVSAAAVPHSPAVILSTTAQSSITLGESGMAAPYIPARETDLVTWADNFAALITATPSVYGLDAAAALIIQTAVDTWDAAYALAVNPSTRTPTTVADKNSAKLAMIPIIRTYASQIRLNPGVTNMDKVALGLNLPNNTPAPIPAPTTIPVLTIMSATPLRHTMKFRDEMASPTSRAKAPLSIGLELWRGIDSIALTDPADADFVGMMVKVPFFSDFDTADVGKVATYFGRWANRAGSAGNNQALTGPWSVAVSMTIVGTG